MTLLMSRMKAKLVGTETESGEVGAEKVVKKAQNDVNERKCSISTLEKKISF